MEIKFNILERQYKEYQKEIEDKAIEILRKGWYVLGKEVEEFEKEFSNYIGSKYCVGVANGLDALIIAFRSLGIKNGDEVIVQANTYIASVMGITINGATPIFVEPNEFYNMDSNKIEEKITERTKAILVTHLYGQATNMDKIVELCQKYDLELIEDCAQSHGAEFRKKKTGNFGIGCFSFYPSKNLGCFGDGGAIVTDRKDIQEKVKMLRNYGSEKRYYNKEIGYNSRLDEIQAGLLRIKLKYLDKSNFERKKIALKYIEKINNKKIKLPKVDENCSAVWHLFVVRCSEREKFKNYLESRGIGTVIHYPIPPHLSEAYQNLGLEKGSLPITEMYSEQVISLPLYNGMTEQEIEYIILAVNEY